MHPILADLRKSLENVFDRASGQSYAQKICPACQEHRPGKWVGGICDRCFRDGRDLPGEEAAGREKEHAGE
jgi:hypothetical protein